MPPHVGLNLLYLMPTATGGMEVYARALVPRLPEAWPEARFTVFAGRELAREWRNRPWHPAVDLVGLPVSSATRVRRTAAEQTLLVAALARHRVGLVHSLGTTTPVAAPIRTVVTIHDVIYKRHPEAHAGLLTRGMALLVPAAARRARRIITGSEAAAGDIVRFLGVDAGKVDVVPDGPGMDPGAAPTPEPELRARLGLPEGPLVLTPAARRPHKNLGRLLEAMRSVDATLVVPGYATSLEEGLEEAIGRTRAVFTGWVSDADLEGLYRAAACLAFPSLAEGFGLPVLEAMRRGLPVACSATTSLPEVAGDAALLFDPLDVDAMSTAIRTLLTEDGLRAELIAKGHERARAFDWRETAAGTVQSYRLALAR